VTALLVVFAGLAGGMIPGLICSAVLRWDWRHVS